MVTQIYPFELQLNKANSTDTKATFLGLHLLIFIGFDASKRNENAMDLILTFLIFRFLDGDVPRSPSYCVYIWLNLFGLLEYPYSHLTDFNAHNKTSTAKLLQQGYQYHKLKKAFSKFYRQHYEWISKYDTRLKHFCSNPDSMATLAQCWHWVVSLADGYPLAIRCWPNAGPIMISM